MSILFAIYNGKPELPGFIDLYQCIPVSKYRYNLKPINKKIFKNFTPLTLNLDFSIQTIVLRLKVQW